MDKLDKIAAAAICGLLLWAGVLVVTAPPPAKDAGRAGLEKISALAAKLDAELARREARVKKMMNGGSLKQAEAMARELVSGFPYSGTPHMLLGDIHLRRQDPVAAMEEYRLAVDLNPDFLDKKTKDFQGKKIKKVVDEAREIIDSRLAQEPDSQKWRQAKKTVYYMLRKIAGSCG